MSDSESVRNIWKAAFLFHQARLNMEQANNYLGNTSKLDFPSEVYLDSRKLERQVNTLAVSVMHIRDNLIVESQNEQKGDNPDPVKGDTPLKDKVK